MKGKHTPGPWKAVHVSLTSLIYAGDSDRKLAVVHQYSGVPDKDEAHRKANARLIASAPELLEALKEVLDDAERIGAQGGYFLYQTVEDQARTAIARAEGREP